MGINTKDNFIKFTLYFINVLLAIIGTVLIGLSFVVQLLYKNDYFLMKHLLQSVLIVFILFGFLSLLFSIFGFIGICKKNFVLISLFLIYLFIIAICLFAFGLHVYLSKTNNSLANKIAKDVKENMLLFRDDQIFTYKNNDYEGVDDDDEQMTGENNLIETSTTTSFNNPLLVTSMKLNGKYKFNIETTRLNYLQSTYKCCGLHGHHDWKSLEALNGDLLLKPYFVQKFLLNPRQIAFNLPDSCCINVTTSCGKDFVFENMLYKGGCMFKLKLLLELLCDSIFIMSLTLTSILALSILFILLTATCIENDYSFREIFNKNYFPEEHLQSIYKNIVESKEMSHDKSGSRSFTSDDLDDDDLDESSYFTNSDQTTDVSNSKGTVDSQATTDLDSR